MNEKKLSELNNSKYPPSIRDRIGKKIFDLSGNHDVVLVSLQEEDDGRIKLNKYINEWIMPKEPSLTPEEISDMQPTSSDYSNWRSYLDNAPNKWEPRRIQNPLIIDAYRDFIDNYEGNNEVFWNEIEDLLKGAEPGEVSAIPQHKPQKKSLKPKSPSEPPSKPSRPVEPQTTTSSLRTSLQRFLSVSDKILLFSPFTAGALSLHFSFAAFYAFLALAVTWGTSGISDLGDIEILPTNTAAADDRRDDFDIDAVVDNRFFILSAVLVVVMVFVVCAIASFTAFGASQRKDFLERLEKNYAIVAVFAASVSALALFTSGMHWAFCLVFAIMMTVSIVTARRYEWQELIKIAYPLAFLANIFLLAVLGEIFGSINGAGGVLPILSLLCLVIGALSKSVTGAVFAAAVTLLGSVILAAINYFLFQGTWFLIQPWDPGTVLILAVIPMANGFWDWVSTSTTRKLSEWALIATEKSASRDAMLRYIFFMLIDLIIAFFTIIGLYLLLSMSFYLYNTLAFPDGSQSASLNDYFQGFQEDLTHERAILVVIMITTVLLPTLFHVHMVCRGTLVSRGLVGALMSFAYAFFMLATLVFLLSTARGILRILLPV